jgi:8-amino-7-oxononanoate synthase
LTAFRDAARRANAALAQAELARSVDVRADRPIDFASNDYLGLARDPAVLAALAAARTVGSGGSRLLSGAHVDHDELERELAQFLGRERVRLFSSGYLAVMGAIQVAAGLVRAIRSDRESHACAIDAIRLARVPYTIFDVAPPSPPSGEPTLVVTESIFSMSGRQADLAALLATLGPSDALLIDEAHALGIAGAHGRGLAAALADERVIVVGTLSKAFGCAGGFVAGTSDFIDLVTSSARTFIFDTSLPPGVAAAARAALERIVAGDALREQLFANVAALAHGLDRPSHAAPSPIMTIPIGDAARAKTLAAALRTRGFFAPAIRPPTVPAGTERLRVSLRADHRPADIAAFTRALNALLAVPA